jgi:hypothetical protein
MPRLHATAAMALTPPIGVPVRSPRRVWVTGVKGWYLANCSSPIGRVELSPQLTAFFTSSPIFLSSAAVNCFSAKAVGHMEPLSRLAESLKPKVAYLVSNFCPL